MIILFTQQVREVENAPVAQVDSVEFFRLPPILVPLLQTGEETGGSEPVVDSSVSSLAGESSSESGKAIVRKKGPRSSSVSQHKQMLSTGAKPKVKALTNPGKVREQGKVPHGRSYS